MALFLFSPAFTLAQDALPAADSVESERIVVTGSNIPTAEEVGPNPVLTIDRDAIEKSGERTAEDLIRNLTVAGPNGVPASNNSAGSTRGRVLHFIARFRSERHAHFDRIATVFAKANCAL